MTRRHLVGATVVAALVTGTACAPKPAVQVGVKDYTTDIVYGSKKKPAPPAPIPAASPNPGFPGFIEPPPPPALGAPIPIAAAPKAKALACPEADIFQIPPEAALDVKAPPAAGPYSFRIAGSVKLGATTTALTGNQDRVLTIVDPTPNTPSWKVAIASGDSVTTTTYKVQRVSGTPDVDGIYITQIVMERPGASPEEFTPADLGLRIFAMPAGLGTAWTSVATDPVHSTSMRLSATETQKRRINACGTVVEGWDSVISGDILGVGPTDKSLHIDATYLVAPQLGGLIVEDIVKVAGTDHGTDVAQDVTATLNAVAPEEVAASSPVAASAFEEDR